MKSSEQQDSYGLFSMFSHVHKTQTPDHHCHLGPEFFVGFVSCLKLRGHYLGSVSSSTCSK